MGYLIRNGIGYTGSGDILNQPVIYSDSERCIGVWRDGKPLYQKTFSFYTGTWNGSGYKIITEQEMGLSYSIINVINIEGCIEGDTARVPIPRLRVNTNWDEAIVWSDLKLRYESNHNQDNQLVYCTIQYTKTTDTAGTGPWAPTGATPIHYSLEEQVVGTWIDGKPLYQKTIKITPSTA